MVNTCSGFGTNWVPGGTCAHCGIGIKYEVVIVGADGARFAVGMDCALKAGKTAGEYMAQSKLDDFRRKVNREVRQAREARHLAEIPALLEAHGAKLADQPHPLKWRASQGDTLADWAEWMLANSGTAGKLKVRRALVKASK